MAAAQFLLVTGNELDAKINGQSDEHGHEGNGQNVQMPNREGSKGEACTPRPMKKTKSRLSGTSVSVNRR